MFFSGGITNTVKGLTFVKLSTNSENGRSRLQSPILFEIVIVRQFFEIQTTIQLGWTGQVSS